MPEGVPWSPATADRLAGRTLVALLVTAIAFYLYRSTLLPGVDFGDTASLQALIGDRVINPRDAYPLYYAIGNLVWRIAGGEAAFGGNLASAICGALACGALTWVAAELTGSLVAAAAGGLLLATSYTFWTQCVIAEVYALHLLMMGLVLTALLWWDRHRTRARLGLVFAVYALSFGNHLMTVLMAPAIVLFVASAPGGVRLLFSRRTIGWPWQSQPPARVRYVWNASYLWALPDPPATPLAFARAFWFDVTKSDWRETMVMAVHQSALMRRSRMYLFDLAQQFGTAGIALALLGLVSLGRRRRVLLLLLSAWVVPFVFAYTYNVGDTHVFFLPSHQIVALLAACGVAALLALAPRAWPSGAGGVLAVLSALVLAYPVWRAWDTWPAVDRHADRRPADWLSAVAVNLGPRDLLLGDVNWQLENGFDYYRRRLHPDLNFTRATDTILTLPFLVRDNIADGRVVYATPIARELARAAYGDVFAFEPDPTTESRPLAARLSGLTPGTLYVLAVLSPYPDLTLDQQELADADATTDSRHGHSGP